MTRQKCIFESKIGDLRVPFKYPAISLGPQILNPFISTIRLFIFSLSLKIDHPYFISIAVNQSLSDTPRLSSLVQFSLNPNHSDFMIFMIPRVWGLFRFGLFGLSFCESSRSKRVLGTAVQDLWTPQDLFADEIAQNWNCSDHQTRTQNTGWYFLNIKWS